MYALERESISSIRSQNKFSSNGSKKNNLYDNSLSHINILDSQNEKNANSQNSNYVNPQFSDKNPVEFCMIKKSNFRIGTFYLKFNINIFRNI
jgi:hypothetical protein